MSFQKTPPLTSEKETLIWLGQRLDVLDVSHHVLPNVVYLFSQTSETTMETAGLLHLWT